MFFKLWGNIGETYGDALYSFVNHILVVKKVRTKLSFLMEIIAGLLGGTIGDNSLNTRKIDQNIERLKELEWFNTIYYEEKYHRLFFVNRHVRGYLQSTLRVNKIIRSQKAQIKFMRFLDKQIQR